MGLASEQILQFLAQLCCRNLRGGDVGLSGAEQGGVRQSKIQLVEEVFAAFNNNSVAALLHQSGEGDLVVVNDLVELCAARNSKGQSAGAACILDGTGAALNQHYARGCVVVQQFGGGKKLEVVCVLNGRSVTMLHEAGDLGVSLKISLNPTQKTIKSVNVGAEGHHQIVSLGRNTNGRDGRSKYGQVELGSINADAGEVLNRHSLFLSMYLSVVTPYT